MTRVADGLVTGAVDEAKAQAKTARQRIASYGHNVLKVESRVRGNITASTEISPGIDSVHTEGHGYYVLTHPRNNEIGPACRDGTGWYDDCAWTIPIITHHRDLPSTLVARAHEEARLYFPEQYDAVVGADPARYGVSGSTQAASAGLSGGKHRR